MSCEPVKNNDKWYIACNGNLVDGAGPFDSFEKAQSEAAKMDDIDEEHEPERLGQPRHSDWEP